MMAKKILPALILGALSAALFSVLLFAGVLDALEWRIDDSLARLSAKPGENSDDVALILLDQASLDWAEEAMGLSWPWPRELYGALTSFAETGGARALGFDVIFSEESFYGPYDDDAYAWALESFGKGVGTVFLSESHGSDTWDSAMPLPAHPETELTVEGSAPTVPFAQFPIPSIGSSYAALANVQVSGDADGVFRRVLPGMIFDDLVVPSMALAMYRVGGAGEGLLVWRGDRVYLDGQRLPTDRLGSLNLRYRGPSGTHPTFSAGEVIRSAIQMMSGDEPQLDPSVLADKYVLFGFSAPGLKDLRPSPMGSTYAGVEIHATMLDNFLSGDFMLRVPGSSGFSGTLYIVLLAILTVGAAFSATAVSGAQKSAVIYVIFILVSVALPALPWFIGLDLPIVPTFAGVLLSLVAAGIYNYATEGKQRRFIKSAFGQYLSPDVINQLIDDPEGPKLGGEKRELTIFFSDLQGFTTISEGLDPEGLTALLNEYLTAMSRIIMDEGGTIDKFEGDAIIAFWNAPLNLPDHAIRGIRASLRCQEVLAEMRDDLRPKAGNKEVLMRIGMNTGPAVVGNMGSVDRFDYTMLGDAVNLAARLEGVNKQFGTYTMVSGATLSAAREKGFQAYARELARVEVVGKSEPVTVYEPMTKEDWERGSTIWEPFSHALSAFYEGRFDDALRGFDSIADIDPPSAKYRGKIESMGGKAPANWNGVWVMTSK